MACFGVLAFELADPCLPNVVIARKDFVRVFFGVVQKCLGARLMRARLDPRFDALEQGNELGCDVSPDLVVAFGLPFARGRAECLFAPSSVSGLDAPHIGAKRPFGLKLGFRLLPPAFEFHRSRFGCGTVRFRARLFELDRELQFGDRFRAQFAHTLARRSFAVAAERDRLAPRLSAHRASLTQIRDKRRE